MGVGIGAVAILAALYAPTPKLNGAASATATVNSDDMSARPATPDPVKIFDDEKLRALAIDSAEAAIGRKIAHRSALMFRRTKAFKTIDADGFMVCGQFATARGEYTAFLWGEENTQLPGLILEDGSYGSWLSIGGICGNDMVPAQSPAVSRPTVINQAVADQARQDDRRGIENEAGDDRGYGSRSGESLSADRDARDEGRGLGGAPSEGPR